MRALIERFTYRYHLWREEQKSDRWGPDPTHRNPLRYVALITFVALILRVAEPFIFHRGLRLPDFAFIPAALAFLVLYRARSGWAWYLCVAWVPFGSVLYWGLRVAGYAPYQPRPREPVLFILFLDLALFVVALVWLFHVRDRYFRYIADASSPNRPNQAMQRTAGRSDD